MKKAILVGLSTNINDDMDKSMEELKGLATACEMEVVGTLVQNLEHPVAATYIGTGKAEEAALMAENLEAEVCIFEDTLSPAQHRNLVKILKIEVMDRTGLILEIFSKRAQTREARLQVESANLQYMLPRLIGMWEAIGRQGGGSGSRSSKGIGETQLELDRRWIQKRMTEVRRELKDIEHDRSIQRGKREKSALPLVALVGYTNAGKSTVMNALLSYTGAVDEKKVLQKDMLFATLDTSIRRIECEDKKDFLLSDTVGFVNKLPHSLIKAFRSTLEEIKYADLLIEVVDASDEESEEQMRVTLETLRELGAEKIPMLHVMNKIDKCPEYMNEVKLVGDKIYMSAGLGEGIDELIGMIKKSIYSGNLCANFMIPYDKGTILNYLNEKSHILEQEYRNEGTFVKADVTEEILGRCKAYVIDPDATISSLLAEDKEDWED